jgi:hypothetical protein
MAVMRVVRKSSPRYFYEHSVKLSLHGDHSHTYLIKVFKQNVPDGKNVGFERIIRAWN